MENFPLCDQMQMPNARATQIMAPAQSWGLTPPAFHMNAGGHGYGSNFPFMELPSQQYDNYHPPVDMLSLDTQSRLGAPTYGREMSMGAHSNNVEHQQAVIAKVKFTCSYFSLVKEEEHTIDFL